MKVINYFDSDNKKYWLRELKKSDWSAGELLCSYIDENTFFKMRGEGAKILLLTEGDDLISYCIYAPKDDIINTKLTPWMGFVYTFPKYRGHHYMKYLFEEVNKLAKLDGYKEVYISTGHVGLYEKYGCIYKETIHDIDDKICRVYIYKIK